MQVMGDGVLRAADKIEAALRQDHGAICELCYRAHIMGHEQDRPTFSARDILHLSEALCLKFRVPDRQDLVDDQNFRLQMRCDREGQSHIHAAAVVFDRRVEKLLHAGEGDISSNFLRISLRLIPRMAPLTNMFSRPVISG